MASVEKRDHKRGLCEGNQWLEHEPASTQLAWQAVADSAAHCFVGKLNQTTRIQRVAPQRLLRIRVRCAEAWQRVAPVSASC